MMMGTVAYTPITTIVSEGPTQQPAAGDPKYITGTQWRYKLYYIRTLVHTAIAVQSEWEVQSTVAVCVKANKIYSL